MKPAPERPSSSRTAVVTGAHDLQALIRPALVLAIADTLAELRLSQREAALLCKTDQPTISKLVRGKSSSIGIGKLLEWLVALGRPVRLEVGPHSGCATIEADVLRVSRRSAAAVQGGPGPG